MYEGQTEPSFIGKVRIVSTVGNVMVAETTDNVSAFDIVLPFKVTAKGVVLNRIAAHFMQATEDIIPNCLLAVPHPRVAIWKKTTPFKVEVIVRGYNNVKSSFYRDYVASKKPNPWGYDIPDILRDNEAFPEPLVTPTTKAETGHDENISVREITGRGIATWDDWNYMKETAIELFARGQKMANELGLILVDTKYEFGKDENGVIYLIDEVHTPDSSRYWYADSYEECLENGKEPKALSKEFLRQWLIDHGFQGRPGDVMPEFTPEFIESISDRYLELYEKMGLPASDLMISGDEADLYECVCQALEKFK